MILCTTDEVPGRAIASYTGLARGSTVRARSVATDATALIKNALGGEIPEYTKLLAEAREQALDRLVQHARAHGADAVVALRITACEIADGAAEILAYGTGVKLAPIS
ncbi:MAG: heavy metal-binding domain-containing protein [Planctomycetota bacterium]|nr:MAG: heavy metal-binding domain-containing protein [Planctomycetota bacterium]